MPKPWLAVVAVALGLPALSAKANHKSIDASRCLETRMEVSQQFGNVFSRAVAFRVDGFDPLVKRISGTGIYQVERVTPLEIVTNSTFLYDGRPTATGETTIKDGGRTICWQGDCSAATDASGVSINPFLWGRPAGKLRAPGNSALRARKPSRSSRLTRQTIPSPWREPARAMAKA